MKLLHYDSFNRNSQIRYPNTSGGGSNAADRELFSYDAYGRMTARRLRDDTLISTSYDSMNRPTFINAPGTADDISYTYDRFGRTLTVSKNGSTITNSYDAFGRRISETSANGTVSYEYDLAGRGTKITYPGTGFYIDYDYDYSGAITHIRENGATSGVGVLASYSYDSYGRRTGVTYGNGASTTYGYNSEYRLHGLTHNLNGTADDLSLNFTYAPTGQITSKVRTNNSYDFDEFANLGDEMTHNGLNQIIANDFGAVSYDARGNVTNAHGKTYGYDIWDNLTSVTGSGHNAALSYDAAGRLAQVTDNGSSTTTKFAYSGTQLIAEYNGAGTLQRRYVHGVGADEPIVWYEGSGTNDRRFLMKDHQGSVIAISNSQGDIIDKNSYSVYGQPDSQNIGRFGYTGQMWIAEAGLYHYKARAYDPSLRRFLQTDPIGYAAGMNIYAYVGGDPINFTDPSGMRQVFNCVTTAIWQNDHGWVAGSDITTCSPYDNGVGFGGAGGSPDGGYIPGFAGAGGGGGGGSGQGEDCTPTQRLASEATRNSLTGKDEDRETAGAIYFQYGQYNYTKGVLGPICSGPSCNGPSLTQIISQVPRGAVITGIWHDHGLRFNTVFSVEDIEVGEPSSPTHGMGTLQMNRTPLSESFEGMFMRSIDANGNPGLLRQYVPGTLNGQNITRSAAENAGREVSCD